MAYSSTALKLLVSPGPGATQVWSYNSTADAIGTIVGAGFFSDGYDKGVKKYDICFTVGGDSTCHAVGMFTTVTASSAATLTIGNLSSTI